MQLKAFSTVTNGFDANKVFNSYKPFIKWFSTFIIDKGSNDGISVDMNVMAGSGLVGMFTGVFEDFED